jgi:UDP-N-acetyl-D-mannosaminuronate dehydrogenase
VNQKKKIVVIGLGEVGKPLFQLISKKYPEAVGVDVNPPSEKLTNIDVLHVCFPYEIKNFIGEAARYIELYKPAVTVINSTVGIGITRQIAERTGAAVVNSPIRGKHIRMLEELSKYVKFIGAMDPAHGKLAADHFESIGMKTKVLTTPEASELAKLTETTYFGLLIAWAQEIERYCDQSGADYHEIVSFYEEIKFFPQVKYTSGVIGGHCVMPNIEILRKFDSSALLDAIRNSNRMKVERDASKGIAQPARPKQNLDADSKDKELQPVGAK